MQNVLSVWYWVPETGLPHNSENDFFTILPGDICQWMIFMVLQKEKKMSVHIVANVMPHSWCHFEIAFSHSEDFLFEIRKSRPILLHWYDIWCHGWWGFRFPKSSAWAEECIMSKQIPFIPYASSLWIQIKLHCWGSHQHSAALLVAVLITHCAAIAPLVVICSGCELCPLCGPTSEVSLPHFFFNVMAIHLFSPISHKNTQILSCSLCTSGLTKTHRIIIITCARHFHFCKIFS